MAAWFLLEPDTVYTLPNMFPETLPGSLYTWLVNKTLFFGSILLLPLGVLGHPLNFLSIKGISDFMGDGEQVSSQNAALIFIMLWMALPYITPLAWANDFYMWWFQIPLEIIIFYFTGHQLDMHWDNNCE